MKEYEIREILATNLSTLFPELNSVKTEYYLPKTEGTRGHIDILAKHKNGYYVIIELKKSDNTARQAIHELIKYSEGLKEKLSLKDSEIQLYLISTNWTELIIPFSSFSESSIHPVSGFKLLIDDSKNISLDKIIPLKLAGNRLFSPHQTCRHYASQAKLEFGITEHEKINLDRGLKNFALVILKSPEIDKAELAKYVELITKQALESTGIEADENRSPISADMLPNSKFVIYQSYLRSSKDHYLELLQENKEYLKETLDYIKEEKLNEEEEISYLEEAALINTGKYPENEFCESAYPSKFKKMINEEGYEIIDIKLFGTLKENELINNEMIIQEFKGLTGSEKVLYQGVADSGSKSQLDEALDRVLLCTENNPIWTGHISHFFNLIFKEQKSFALSTTVFNPFNILISLFRCLKYQTDDFMPFYELNLQFNDKHENDKMYYGIITWNGQNAPELDKIVEDYFEGEQFNLVSPMLWGGDIRNNLQVLRALGLTYSSILIEHKNGTKIKELIFREYEFQEIEAPKFKTIYDFVESNIDFLLYLSSIIESHSLGANNEMVFNMRNGETPDV
jgi:hypothetical protein